MIIFLFTSLLLLFFFNTCNVSLIVTLDTLSWSNHDYKHYKTLAQWFCCISPPPFFAFISHLIYCIDGILKRSFPLNDHRNRCGGVLPEPVWLTPF